METQENIFDKPVEVEVSKPISAVSGLPAPQSEVEMEAMLERAELAIKFQKRIKIAALKLTNENDWCFQGDTPFLEHSGAKKLMQAFGVSVYPNGPVDRQTMKDDKGEYIIIRVPLRGVWHGSEVSEVGVCSTRDKLLGMKGGDYKPLSEVSLVNVELKAQTIAIRRAVRSVLAMNPTAEEMAEAGLDVEKIKAERGVNYSKGSKGGSTDSKELKARKVEVGNKLLKMYGKDGCEAKLEELTSFETDGKVIKGKRTLRYVSEKAMYYLEKEVNKLFENHELDIQAAKDEE